MIFIELLKNQTDRDSIGSSGAYTYTDLRLKLVLKVIENLHGLLKSDIVTYLVTRDVSH